MLIMKNVLHTGVSFFLLVGRDFLMKNEELTILFKFSFKYILMHIVH
jgi:hypothetical protein